MAVCIGTDGANVRFNDQGDDLGSRNCDKFTADYRDFAAMKLIYILPGVLPFALALLEGMQAATERLSHVRIVRRIVHCALLCLVILHGAGIISLVNQLAGR